MNETPVDITELKKAVVQRLKMFGVDGTDPEISDMLDYIISARLEHIANDLNLDFVPQGLFFTVVEMMAGTYLLTAYMSGSNSSVSVDTIKTISEGDTSITYAVEGSTSGAETLKAMADGNKGELSRYRRIQW